MEGTVAKKEKDFSNPKKLGIMRVLEIYWILGLAMVFVIAMVATKEVIIVESFSGFTMFLCIVLDSVSVWLLMTRKRFLRTWSVICIAIMSVVGCIAAFVFDGSGVVGAIDYCFMYALIALYMHFSRRAKGVLVQPFNSHTREEYLAKGRSFFQPKTWVFWRNLIMYFCVFSVVGHWMEAGYCLFIKWGLIPGKYDPASQIWSDWFFPFCVYGVGAVCCVLMFYPVKMFLQHKIKLNFVPLVLSFAWNALVCTGIELAMGLMLNQPVNGVYPLWDYSNMFCNFMGQVCLQNALAFGFVATLMTWVIYPAMERLLARLPEDGAQGLFIGIVAIFVILFALYCVKGVVMA